MKKILIQNMKNKGFTLLELLVVIGIIGIMMALATVAYSSIQESGRNSRRKQDLVAIQNALEQYYSETDYVYPTTCSTADTYLKSSWPVDPSSALTYESDLAASTGCAANAYCLCAAMEPVTSTSGNSGALCSWSTGKNYFCVANLQ